MVDIFSAIVGPYLEDHTLIAFACKLADIVGGFQAGVLNQSSVWRVRRQSRMQRIDVEGRNDA